MVRSVAKQRVSNHGRTFASEAMLDNANIEGGSRIIDTELFIRIV